MTDIIISITVQAFIVCATADHPKPAPFTCDGVMDQQFTITPGQQI
ncbi:MULTISPECIES: hypothetical protein [Peribacillus]|uniref:Uncharacterized protein n=1 Tax=Peribacillus castrilensis TaxID=2897690 RepID=A0AAW9MZE5_9BACI|nr:hypothetical protein [Peribacillus frigoritolerans]MEC0271593.1 hypothetical protein [Peribacillus castrilensis]MEC0347013.1 hypothetical protein [Peribacillus castrilensis]